MILFLMHFGDFSALPVLGETSKTPKNLNSKFFFCDVYFTIILNYDFYPLE